jgi:peroxiredoxin
MLNEGDEAPGYYDATGAVVLGVSPDEPAKLRKFADKYGLDFTLSRP